MDGQGTVIVATLAAGGIRLAGQFKKLGPSPEHMRTILGTFILTGILLLVAEFQPASAQALAVAVLVTALALNGSDVFALIGDLVK